MMKEGLHPTLKEKQQPTNGEAFHTDIFVKFFYGEG